MNLESIGTSFTVQVGPENVQVGELKVLGFATPPTTLNLNLSGFESQLDNVITQMEAFPTLEVGTYVSAYNQENGQEIVGDAFEREFQRFLPDQRIVYNADHSVTYNPDGSVVSRPLSQTELNDLADEVATEAANMLAAVQADYAAVGNAITISGDSGDVAVNWVELPLGVGGMTGTDFNRALFSSVFTDPLLGDGAKSLALGFLMNPNRQQSASHACQVSGDQLIDYDSSLATFGQYAANYVSHELGHTFGLLDAYYFGTVLNRVIYTEPYDLMGPESSTDGVKQFDPRNIVLLEAAMGTQPDGDTPMTDEIEIQRLNANHPGSNAPAFEIIDDAPRAPELSISLSDGEGLHPGATIEASPVAADGPGGKSSTLHLVLQNTGSAPLNIQGSVLSIGTAGFAVAGQGLGGTQIAPGATETLDVAFDPATPGVHSDTLVISSDAEGRASYSIQLQGAAIPEPPTAALSLGPDNLGGVAVGKSVTSARMATITNSGALPLTISSIQVEAGGSSFMLTGLPANLATNPISLETGQSFTFGVEYTASKLGLERAKIDVATNDPNHSTLSFGVDGTGLGPVVYPHWGNDYVAIEFPRQSSSIVLRTKSDAAGNFSFFVPPDAYYHIAVFDPVTGLVANGYGTTSASGQNTDLTRSLVFGPSTAKDTDYDGLPDDVEFAVGTNPKNAYTAGDGIDDFTHVITDQTDPAGLVPLATGVVSLAPLQGEAEAVALAGSLQSSQGLTAYVATGSYGLAVVDVSQFQKPVVLGQMQLPGDSTDVSVDPGLQIAAVASNSALELVDVSNPAHPAQLHSLDIAAEAVKAYEGVAYAATGNQVTAVDLATGDILATETFGGGNVDDLAIDQGNLYVLASQGVTSHTVYKIVLNGATLPTPAESLTITGHPTFGRMHLFAANSLIYVGASDNNDSQEIPGVEVLKDDGTNLTLVGPPSGITAFDVTTNGSGLALYTGANPGLEATAQVGLLNLSDPTNTDHVITVFNTPGVARAVAMADGLGFVADDSAGLAILNYLPFDTKGIPPSATISLPASQVTGKSGSTLDVVEGSTVPILANVTDDVQVRNVELIVNGQAVQNAVSAPYSLSIALPSLARNGSAPITVQVRATDTGGNVGLSNTLTIGLVKDTTPPQLASSNIPDGATVGVHFQTVILQFSKPLEESTVTTADFLVIDSDSTVIKPLAVQFRNDDRTVQVTIPTLQVGKYRFVIDAHAITDRPGNVLGAGNITSHFNVLEYSAVWDNPDGGNWSDPANWDSGAVPGSGADVSIDITDSRGNRPTITYDSGSVEIDSLISKNPFVLAGGTLKVDSSMEVDNTLTLAGAALQNAHVVKGPGSQAITAESLTQSTLDNVYLGVGIDLSQSYGASIAVQDGLALSGTNTLGGGNSLRFLGAQTLSGSGTLALDGGSLSTAGSLTVAPTITIEGTGQISGDSFVNQGTISAAGANQSLNLTLNTFTNQGALSSSNGASLSATGFASGGLGTVSLAGTGSTLSLDGNGYTVASSLGAADGQTLSLLGSWTTAPGVTISATHATLGLGATTSLSAVKLTNSTIEIESTYTFAQIQPLLAGGNRLEIGPGGVLANTGVTLGLSASTGSLTLDGGTLEGGTVTATGGAKIVVAANSFGSTLDGVTLDSDVDLTGADAQLAVTSGLTLNGTVSLDSPTEFSSSTLEFDGTQTLGGAGGIIFGQGNNQLAIDSGSTLTIGPNITIRGDSGAIGTGDGDRLINQGTIKADANGSGIVVSASTFENQGTIGASNGGSLSVDNLSGPVGATSLAGTGSVLSISGTGYTVNNSLSATSGQTLGLLGTWTKGTGVTITVTGATFGLGSTPSFSGITLNNSTLDVQAKYALAQIQPLRAANNQLTIGSDGVLDDTGATLTLSATTGDLTLDGGTLKGGTVSASGGAKVVVTQTSSGSTLDGVTLDSDLNLSSAGANCIVIDGLTLNGTASLGSRTDQDLSASLEFSGSQTLGGKGSVVFGKDFYDQLLLDSGSTLTIGSNITIHGTTGAINTAGSVSEATLISLGKIEADGNGGTLAINVSFENQGTLGAASGGTLTVTGLTGNLGSLSIAGAGSSISIDGTGYTVDKSVSADGGQTLRLLGTWSLRTGATVTVTGGTFGLGSPTSFAGITLTDSTLDLQADDTYAQVKPLLSGSNRLAIGQNGTLENTGGTLALNASTGDITLDGGTLIGGAVNASGGATVVVSGDSFESTLEGVTLNGNLDLTADGANLTITGGLTENGTILLGSSTDYSSSTLDFGGTQALLGAASVVFGAGDSRIYVDDGSTLTLGPNVTVEGQSGTIDALASDGSSALINQGAIEANENGGTLTISTTSFQNQGTVGAANGGSLTVTGLSGNLGSTSLAGNGSSLSIDGTGYTVNMSLSAASRQTLGLLGTWTLSPGVTVTAIGAKLDLGNTPDLAGINLSSSTLDLQGNYALAQIEPLLAANNQLTIDSNGVLDDTGASLTLNATTGDLVLAGGTLVGGTVNASGGAEIVVTGGSSATTLDGVTLNSALDLTADQANLTIVDGLTLNGSIVLGSATDYSNSTLDFSGSQTLLGSGQVIFGSGGGQITGDNGSTLTIGPNIAIHGSSGTLGPLASDDNFALINQGTIEADGNAGALAIDTATFQNQGTLSAVNGGTLTVTGLTGNLGTTSLAGLGSGLSVSGTGYTVDKSLNAASGQSLRLLGAWSLGTAATVTVTSGTFGLGSPTSFAGITLTNSTLDLQASDTYAQIQPLLSGNNRLALGAGGTLENTGGTLTLSASTGDLTLDGGTIMGGTVSASGGAKVAVSGDASGSSLDGVTLNSDLDMTADRASLTIKDGLTLNGTASIGAHSSSATTFTSSSLNFAGSQTLGGIGNVVFGEDGSEISIDDGSTLTVGPNMTMEGSSGTIGSFGADSNISTALVNQGTIEADGNGGTLAIDVSSFQNQGTLGAVNGGTLTATGLAGNLGATSLAGLGSGMSIDGTGYTVNTSLKATSGQTLRLLGTWSVGTGATVTVTGGTFGIGSPTSYAGITVTNSTLDLQASDTYTQIQPLLSGTNRLAIGARGTLENTGGTLALNMNTGDLMLDGGTIMGGTVSASGGARIKVSGDTSGSTLDGVTLKSDLDLTNDTASLTITDGLTLDGTASIGSATASMNPSGSSLDFMGSQALGGTGEVVFGDDDSEILIDEGSTLTIGPNMTIHGGAGIVGDSYDNVALINEGTIEADGSGGSLAVNTSTFQNQGTIGASNGSTLTVTGLIGDLGTASLAGKGSSISISGTGYTVNKSLIATSGQSLSLLGTWTTESGVTITSTGATLGLGSTASLSGITLADSTLDVQGNYSFAQVQPLLAGNNQLAIGSGGTLDATGATITLNASTGNLTLDGGTIQGGTVLASGGAKVVVSGDLSGSTLDAVTLNSDLDLTAPGAALTVLDGLTLNGVASLGSSNLSSTDVPGSSLTFSGTQTLSGNAVIVFGAALTGQDAYGNANQNILEVSREDTLTLARTVVVHGNTGVLSGGRIVNNGVVDADTAGGTITITSAIFNNLGTVQALSGTLAIENLTSIGGMVTVGAKGSIDIAGSLTLGSAATVNVGLGGTSSGQFGTIAVAGPAALAGTLDVALAGGFEPLSDDLFPVLNFGSDTGAFAQVTGPNLPGGLAFSLVYGSRGLSVKVS
jgi:hypothetical protein